ncbi:hypothetical protein HY502_03230 [Candidatus Woesebacteria bacterium]|nr:hypothetical protein [Candidatus Woesebacteria bacterium]
MTAEYTKKGVSLFEIVIVVGIFAVVALLTTRSTFLTLRGSRKSDSQIKLKENIEYALSIVERQLRNSNLVTSACDGSSLTRIDYADSQGTAGFFSCVSIGPTSGYIASGSARLTSSEISITSCSFVCLPQEGGVPTEVTINLSAKEVNSLGAESATVTTSTKVFLRNY